MYVTAYNQSVVFFNILPCLCLVFSLYVEEATEYVLCSDSELCHYFLSFELIFLPFV